jgi:hypothetical protein
MSLEHIWPMQNDVISGQYSTDWINKEQLLTTTDNRQNTIFKPNIENITSNAYLPLYWGVRVAQWVRSLDLTTLTSLSPIRRGFAPSFVNYKKGCTRLTAASDKAYQLLAHGRWISPASSTTKTGRHDIAEILLKVALKHQKSK